MTAISKLTWFYGIFIVISASFLQQLLFKLNNMIGESAVGFSFFIALFILIVLFIYYAFKHQLPFKQISVLLLLIIFSIILIAVQRFFAERTHVVMYGLLGYLAIKDMVKLQNEKIKAIIHASLFALLINISDEIFQAILPYRVGEIQDILTNYISSALGIFFYFTLKRPTLD